MFGLSSFDGVAAVKCLSSSDPGPANPTYMRIREKDSWHPGVAKEHWALPRDMSIIAMYSTAHANRPSLTIQPVSSPGGFRTVKITLMDFARVYSGGEYTLVIPDGENNCVAELQEKGMNVVNVAAW